MSSHIRIQQISIRWENIFHQNQIGSETGEVHEQDKMDLPDWNDIFARLCAVERKNPYGRCQIQKTRGGQSIRYIHAGVFPAYRTEAHRKNTAQ